MKGSAITLGAWLYQATNLLAQKGVDAPRLSAELLLGHVLGVSRLELIVYPERMIPPKSMEQLTALLHRRAKHEPMAYLTGIREFYGRSFTVTPDTLIPRPETEHLVDLALECTANKPLVFADFGTGSGSIAITLCLERPLWHGIALDRSIKALAVAKNNAHDLGVADRLFFVQADFCQAALQSCDLIVSNPPYIPQGEWAELQMGVRDFEPSLALTPGPSGLEHIRMIIRQAQNSLRVGGWLLLEHAHDQGDGVQALLKNNTWHNISTFKDFSGHDRVTKAQKTDFVPTL